MEGDIMATVNLNISEKEKAQFDFLVDVNNEIINKGGKTSKTSILRDLLQEYFKRNEKYLDAFEEMGKLAALQKIEVDFNAAKADDGTGKKGAGK